MDYSTDPPPDLVAPVMLEFARFLAHRDELLNGEIFYTLREAQIVIEQWRRHYNTKRLRSFPWRLLPESVCPMSGPTRRGEDVRSPSPAPSDASIGQPSSRHTLCASDRTLPRSRQSNGLRQLSSFPGCAEHQPGAALRRSLPVCSFSST